MENQNFQQDHELILEAYAETIRAPLMLEIERLHNSNNRLALKNNELLAENNCLESAKKLSSAADALITQLRDQWAAVKSNDVEKQIEFFWRVAAGLGINSDGNSNYDKSIKIFLSRAYGRKIVPLLILLNEQALVKYLNSVQYPSECAKSFLLEVIKNPFYPVNGNYNNTNSYYQEGAKLEIRDNFNCVPYSELAKSPHWQDQEVFELFISGLTSDDLEKRYKLYQYVILMAIDAYKNDVEKLEYIGLVLSESDLCRKIAESFNWVGTMSKLANICITASPVAAKALLWWANTATNSLVHISKFPASLRKDFFSTWSIEPLVSFLEESPYNKSILPVADFIEIVKNKVAPIE